MENFSLRDLQLEEFDILLEVDRVCKKNNIKYFLNGGTLLGAIRHKGFIPWDDDIDICMPIKDYRRFCKIAPKELGNRYFLQNFKTDKVSFWFSKVRKNDTTAIESGCENKLCHQGIWIDIFPLAGIKDDKRWLKSLNKKANFAKMILSKKIGLMEDTENNFWYVIANKLIPLFLCKFIASIIFRVVFKDLNKYTYCDNLWSSSHIIKRFSADCFSEAVDVEFEGHTLPAPKGWKEYLTRTYGDYMTPPPPEKRNGGCHTIQTVDINNDYTKYTKRPKK